ncbi:MAG: hypothetical protein EZS28_022498 [Streblomastix strix]|uniref:Uncharacterized protein n=1 Tax=Streblomastix strix TaxID=222440 RepID=A0A5J4VHX3_9EUKA|nr:MAG: hypothetical protein EZS28_022498 [Streblomastix strix]
MEKQSLRDDNSIQMINSFRVQNQSSSEVNQQIGQIVLRLKQVRISESEQISALQQIIIIAVSASDGPSVARDSGVIEAASTLLGQSQSTRVKQLCGVVISVVGQLGIENSGKIDWTIACAPLIAMLLSSDDVISNVGKNSITILLEQNENAVVGILQMSFIDRATEVLSGSYSNTQSSSSIQAIYPIVTMNILLVLDSLLTIANERIPRTPKLIEVLLIIQKEGRTNSIKQKAKMLLLVLQSESQSQNEGPGGIERNDENQQLKKELLESERKRIEAEERNKIFEVQLKQSGQETEDLLRSINGIYNKPELKQSNWIEMKNELQLVEVGTEIQKDEIRQRKIKTCQKIVAVFIGKKNNEGKKLAIESGIIDALLNLLITYPLGEIAISHIWALQIFTYASNNEIKLLLISKNSFQALLHLFDHPNIFVVNRVIASIYNILLAGSNTTASSDHHPHFATIQALDGIQKLYALFQKNASQYSKNFAAECPGELFKSKELPDNMKREIISHFKAILIRSEDNEKDSAKDALSQLAQNSANLAEIMKDVDLNQIANNLRKKLYGNEEQQKQIKIQQDGDCWILASILSERKDDEIRLRIINSGIVDALLHIFLTRDLKIITHAFSQAFFVLITKSSDEFKQSLYEKHPYPALIRLLNHQNIDIADDSITSIFNIMILGTDTTSISEQHPHFVEIQSCDGIRKLFDLFKRNDITKHIKDTTSRCIGFLFRSQEIPDKQMQTEIIAHLKALLNDSDDWGKNAAKNAIKYLSQNAANRTEIEKDGFVIPD